MHVGEIPDSELVTMLNKRCGVAESRATKMVAVMRELQRRRKNANVLAGKYGFITPRDLFRWAERHRDAETSSMDSCAVAGFMLLGEALRNSEDKATVAEVLASIMLKGKPIDTSTLYDRNWQQDIESLRRVFEIPSNSSTSVAAPDNPSSLALSQLDVSSAPTHNLFSGLVDTHCIRRMMALIGSCLHHSEAVLLVGETGSGKTSVCQAFARTLGKQLIILNCHQHTETSDILGGYRPVRSRELIASRCSSLLKSTRSVLRCALETSDIAEESMTDGVTDGASATLDMASARAEIEKMMEAVKVNGGLSADAARVCEEQMKEYDDISPKMKSLFEWSDGPLLDAMRNGHWILLDEVSLVDDAVLERLNSVSAFFCVAPFILFDGLSGSGVRTHCHSHREGRGDCASSQRFQTSCHHESWRRFRKKRTLSCVTEQVHRDLG
jgi:midasin